VQSRRYLLIFFYLSPTRFGCLPSTSAALFVCHGFHAPLTSDLPSPRAHFTHYLLNDSEADGLGRFDRFQNYPTRVLNGVKLFDCACPLWHTSRFARFSWRRQEVQISNGPTTGSSLATHLAGTSTGIPSSLVAPCADYIRPTSPNRSPGIEGGSSHIPFKLVATSGKPEAAASTASTYFLRIQLRPQLGSYAGRASSLRHHFVHQVPRPSRIGIALRRRLRLFRLAPRWNLRWQRHSQARQQVSPAL
jgi:hypothetical protein